MTRVLQVLVATLGRVVRSFFFLCLRSYLSLFYNISISNKHLLQDMNGGLILASHGTRLDGPMVVSLLYPTRRILPAVLYNEYYHPAQYLVMAPTGAIPLSSPKDWPEDRRAAQKAQAQEKLNAKIQEGRIVLLFPGGQARRQPREIIRPHFSGAYETLRANPGCPIAFLRIQGISKFDAPIHDRFWSFLGLRKGRRHVSITIERLDGELDTNASLEAFNADLEERLNAPPHWPAA